MLKYLSLSTALLQNILVWWITQRILTYLSKTVISSHTLHLIYLLIWNYICQPWTAESSCLWETNLHATNAFAALVSQKNTALRQKELCFSALLQPLQTLRHWEATILSSAKLHFLLKYLLLLLLLLLLKLWFGAPMCRVYFNRVSITTCLICHFEQKVNMEIYIRPFKDLFIEVNF